MKKLMFLVVLSVIFGVGEAKATTCAVGTAASYQGTSCSFDGLNFSNFGSVLNASPGLALFTASDITVTPVANANGVGFVLTPTSPADWTTNQSSQTLDLNFAFVVSCASGTACIDDIYEQLMGTAQTTTVPGGTSGVDTLTETYCLGSSTLPAGSCSGGTSGEQSLTVTPTSGGTASANPTFSPVISLAMNKDISAQSFNTNTASVISLTDEFSLVPEPSSLAMLIAGLSGLGLFSLRRKSVV